MFVNLLKYLSVYLSATVKFLLGIIVGVSEGLTLFEVAFFTFLGAMTTVVVVVSLGNLYRESLVRFLQKIKVFIYSIIYQIIGVVQHKMGREQTASESLQRRLLKRQFSKSIRFTVKIWKRFGIVGIAILTPLILSPIGGALLALSFKVDTKKTIVYMALSHLVFALLFSFVFIEFKDIVENNLGIQLRKKH